MDLSYARFRRYQAKKTPSLMAAAVFMIGGGAFMANTTINGYSTALVGMFAMLAGLLLHLESMDSKQAEQVRLLEDLADAEGDS